MLGQVTWSGSASSGIMIMGQSPWIDEVREGRPFAGASGRLLDSQLKRAGLDRKDVLVTNVLWEKPPYLGWVEKHPDAVLALERNRPNWENLIERVHPKVIMTLGDTAMQQVLGVSNITNRHSYCHDSKYGVAVVPTFHPSHILQGNNKLTQCLFFAISRAKEVAQANGEWHREPVTYYMDPTVEQAREYLFGASGEVLRDATEGGSAALRSSGLLASQGIYGSWATIARIRQPAPRIPLLVADIETPNSANLDEEEREDKDPSYTIVRLSFSVAHATALSMPWTEPYITLAKEALAAAAVIVPWNGDGFDLPRLAYNGCSWQGEVHDAMWAWHFLQSDMLKGLGFVAPFFCDLPPWKHLSDADPPYYSCCDADAQYRCYVAIRRALEQAGRWPRFVRHCIRAGEIFRRPNTGRITVNRAAQAALKVRLEQERDAELERLQTMVPDAAKPRHVYKTIRTFDADPDKGHWEVRQHPCPCRDNQGEVPTDIEEIKL